MKLGSIIIVTDNTHDLRHDDPQLALQTATAYFFIREIPSTTIHDLAAHPSLLEHPTNSQNSIGGSQTLSKSVLEYIFLSVLIVIILCVIFRTIWVRQRRQSFPASRRNRRPVELQPLHPDGQAYPAYPREIPAAYIHPSRRTRAHDIDSSGRRQDIPTEMDHDGDLGANDTLPAYDTSGGPPKYFEVDTLGRNRPAQSGITQGPDASWENINISSSENPGPNTPPGTTHAAQASQRLTPPYYENSSSDESLPTIRPRHET